MCELLGVNSNKYTNVTFSFQQLIRNSEDNPHGWGLAFYPYHLPKRNMINSNNVEQNDFRVAIFREDHRLKDSIFIHNLKEYFHENLRSKNILAHIRKSTTTQTYANTHPFSRELWGHDWTLIHNGKHGVDHYFRTNYFSKKELHYYPIGQTGSDKILCILLSELKNQIQPEVNVGENSRIPVAYDFLECAEVIHDILCKMKENGADVNIILSDGIYMLGFFSGYNKLHYIIRNKGEDFSNVRLNDPDYKNIGLIKAHDEQSVIIATEKITNEDWKEFDYNHGVKMIVCQDGKVLRKYFYP